MGKFRIIDELEPAGDFKIAQSSDIAYNDKSVGETLDDLALVAEQVTANTSDIAQNTSDISEQSGKIETLTGKVTAAETAIAGKASAEAVTQLQTEMDVQKARMDQLVEDPEVGVDEIADARIDNTGKTYANLGDHIRGTETSLKETINGFKEEATIESLAVGQFYDFTYRKCEIGRTVVVIVSGWNDAEKHIIMPFRKIGDGTNYQILTIKDNGIYTVKLTDTYDYFRIGAIKATTSLNITVTVPSTLDVASQYVADNIPKLKSDVAELQTSTTEINTELSNININLNGKNNDFTFADKVAGEWERFDVQYKKDEELTVTINDIDASETLIFVAFMKKYDATRYQSTLFSAKDTKKIIMSDNYDQITFGFGRVTNSASINVRVPGVNQIVDNLSTIDPDSIGKVFTIGRTDNVITTLINAMQYKNSTVYIDPYEHDLIAEYKAHYGADYFDTEFTDSNRGLELGNGIRIIGRSGNKLKCHYTGNNDAVMAHWSPFNNNQNDIGYTIENVNFDTKKVRYVIHDERGSSEVPYSVRYSRCSFAQDQTGSTWDRSRACIGGGLGAYADVVVEDCIFSTVTSSENMDSIAYHNSASAKAENSLVIKNCYCEGNSTLQLASYGESTKKTKVIVANCSFGSQIEELHWDTQNAPNYNFDIKYINNQIRS